MTGSAGTAALHLCHGKTLGILSGRKYAVVAIDALIETRMKLVTEKGRACLRNIIRDLLGRQVTATTVPLHRKGQVSIMAGATGPVLLHLSHGIALVFTVSSKECIMTITAAVHFKVPHMGENCIGPEVNILYGVALAAILGN